ncbi:unnamed protein product [Aspergillus oryzae]|uniref:Unnamed protein product n=1 Tax=Aspergillus oryzae TaxID=5062 RepID=A0AAN5C211_ASPOZ|nr:unnamed protein product [Aspergillus oryzae]GMG34691.1 unnamed protein product [Aspergillus oryzae]
MDLSGEIPVGRKVPSNKEVGWQSQAVNGFKRWIKEKVEDMDVKSNSGRRFLRASLEVGQTKEGKLDEKKENMARSISETLLQGIIAFHCPQI